MNDDYDDTSEPELTADEEALLKEMPTLTDVGQARRSLRCGGGRGWRRPIRARRRGVRRHGRPT